MKIILTGIFTKGYDAKLAVGKDVLVNGEKHGTIIGYDPKSGNITAEVDETVLKKTNRIIGISSRGLCSKALKAQIVQLK